MVWHPELILLGFWALVAMIQLAYYWLVFAKLAFYRGGDSAAQPSGPVSIVICAKNEEANLHKNLPLILEQEYYHPQTGLPNYEVLVVDDNSDDGSEYVLNDLKKAYPHLNVLYLNQEGKLIRGKKFPLSVGIREARFNTLLLTDADCVPASRQWLSKMVGAYDAGTEVVLGYGPYFKENGFLNTSIRFETFFTALQYLSFALAGKPYMGVGRNLSYTKQLFMSNKGFSGHTHIASGDDDLFINKVANHRNTRVVIAPETFMYSEPKQSWEQWQSQKQRHMSTGKHYTTAHQLRLGIFSASHFLFWLLLPFVAILALEWWPVVLGVFVLRLCCEWFIFGKSMQQLRERDLVKWVPVFDFLLFIYYFKMAPAVFSNKSSKWK